MIARWAAIIAGSWVRGADAEGAQREWKGARALDLLTVERGEMVADRLRLPVGQLPPAGTWIAVLARPIPQSRQPAASPAAMNNNRATEM